MTFLSVKMPKKKKYTSWTQPKRCGRGAKRPVPNTQCSAAPKYCVKKISKKENCQENDGLFSSTAGINP